MILVVCALSEELRGFQRSGVEVVAVGVGPVEAGLGTLRALGRRPVALTVNAGIGGGFRGRAAVGDAVAVTHEHYAELGREDRVPLALPGGAVLVDACAADAAVLARLERDAPGCVFGSGVTSATVTTSDERAADLAARYDPTVESMEGFAVLRAAAAAGIPAVEVRGISNLVGRRESSGWDLRAGAAAAVRALDALVTCLGGTP